MLLDTVEQRPGDFLWNIHKQHVNYVKYEILENYGGSGAHTAQLYVIGAEEWKNKLFKLENLTLTEFYL